MQPHAIITPLKAIRMLLNGSAVLVRAERWEEITVPARKSRWSEQHATCQETITRVRQRAVEAEAETDLLQVEVKRLNRLVETLSRAIGRYQDEEVGHAPGSHPFIPLSGSRDTSGEYTRCSVMGCTRTRIQHPGEW